MATSDRSDDRRPTVAEQEFLLNDPVFLQDVVRGLVQELLGVWPDTPSTFGDAGPPPGFCPDSARVR